MCRDSLPLTCMAEFGGITVLPGTVTLATVGDSRLFPYNICKTSELMENWFLLQSSITLFFRMKSKPRSMSSSIGATYISDGNVLDHISMSTGPMMNVSIFISRPAPCMTVRFLIGGFIHPIWDDSDFRSRIYYCSNACRVHFYI